MSEARFGWLVSYPRSGNTWLRFMLASLIEGGGPVDINETKAGAQATHDEFDEVSGIDSALLTDEEIQRARPALYSFIARGAASTPILRKVHDRCWRNAEGSRMFPPEVSLGAVYIVRDPRDVAVSYAHFSGAGIDETIRRMGDAGNTIGFRLIQFPQPLGSWSEHVVSWLDDSGMPIHRVRYEDLLAEPAAELAKVAVFLGMSPDGAPGAAAATQFENLRAQEEERGFRDLIYETRFFRQGRVGGWRSALSAAQVERIERDHGEVMARLGYL